MPHNIQSDHMKQTYTIAMIFMVAIIIATVLNGTSFWLKRVGWMEPQLYQEYQSKNFRGQEFKDSDSLMQLTRCTYQTKGVWTAFKASKDVVFLLFIIVSLLLILRGYTEWKIRYVWLFVSMAFLFLYAFVNPFYSLALVATGRYTFISVPGSGNSWIMGCP